MCDFPHSRLDTWAFARPARRLFYDRIEEGCEAAAAGTMRLLWALCALPRQAAEVLERDDFPGLGQVFDAQSQLLQSSAVPCSIRRKRA